MLLTKVFPKAWQEENQLARNFKNNSPTAKLPVGCKYEGPLQLSTIN